MRILLHICCAPCAIYTINRLREEDHTVEGLFYNPNIHPTSEYMLRRGSVEKLSKELGITIAYFRELEFEDYYRKVNLHEKDGRCHICWRLRLAETAEYASKKGFEGFTTTLLISPYQDHQKIKEMGEDVAKRYSISFAYEDFRPGFRESHRVSKAMELYHQKYCGCIYSERERVLEKVSKAKQPASQTP